jgi:hypothetical protein
MNLLRNLILVVFGACQSGQEIEDDKFMQGVLAPIVRGQTKMMTNNEVVTLLIDSHAIINLNHSTYKSSRHYLTQNN